MSRNRFTSTRLVVLILLILAGTLSGCGKKGPVRPIRQPIPKAPEEFVLRQQGRQMLLIWSLPRQNDDESPLTDLAGFRIYRSMFDAGDECPECLETPNQWRLVDLEYLRDVQRVGDRFFLNDSDLVIGRGYQYRIIPYNRWGQDGHTALARLVLNEPPPAPVEAQVRKHENGMTITWQPVKNLPAEMQLLGYNVYRRRPGRPFPPAPQNRQPLDSLLFEDRDFTAEKTYLYAVRTVVLKGDQMIESPLSDLAVTTDLSEK